MTARAPRGLIVAAPGSGVGKTTVTLALARALADAGWPLQPAKTGPDFIDPAYLGAAARRPAINLDPWSMRASTLGAALSSLTPHDILLVEGVTGLFDGAADGSGSTADLAIMLGLPVVLVVDAAGMGASVAALVEGFVRHRPGLGFAGLILNRVGSARHEAILRRALVGLPVLGCLPRDPALALPSRHLGLVQAREHPDLETYLDRAARLLAASIDLAGLVASARSVRRPGSPDRTALPPPGQRIALAQDVAFAFTYPHVIDGWRRAGSEILPFSPLNDEAPDRHADAVHLPGGYPELHAGTLAQADGFLAGLRAAAARGATIHGECGGYMVLGRRLIDRDGRAWPMAGLLPVVTSFARPQRHLGYRRIELASATFLGAPGQRYRGHEFHYSCEVEREGPSLYVATTADGEPLGLKGCVAGRVSGSFLHLVDQED